MNRLLTNASLVKLMFFFVCVLLYMYCVSHAFLIFVYFLPSYIFLTQNSKCAGLADSVEPPIQGLFVLGCVFAASDKKLWSNLDIFSYGYSQFCEPAIWFSDNFLVFFFFHWKFSVGFFC